MKRFCILSICAFFGLTALLFVFRLQAGNYLFTRILQQAGANNIKIALARVTGKEIVFTRVDCTLKGNRISMQAGSFSWSGAALKQRQLDTITIDSLVIDLTDPEQAVPEKRISPEQVRGQLEQIRKALPFRNLIISHLTLNGSTAGDLAGRDLSLRLKKNNPALFAELAFNDQSLALTLNSPSSNQWNLDLKEPGQGEPFLSAWINLQNNHIRAEIDTDLARVDRLNPLLKKPLPKMEGKFSGMLAVFLNKKPKADLVLSLQQLEVAGIRAASVKVTLHGRMDATGTLRVEDHSILKILNLQKENTSTAALTIDLDGTLERIQGDWQFSFAPEAGITATELNGPNLKIKSIEIAPAIVGILSKDTITLHLQPEWRARISNVQSGSLTVSETEVQPEQNKNVHITVALDSGLAWNISPSRWQWIIQRIRQHNLSIEPTPISINIEQLTGIRKNLQIKTDMTSQHIGLISKENGLSIENIRTEFTADAGKCTGTASFSPETIPGTLAVRFSYNLKNGLGKATVNSEQPFSFSEITPLSSLLDQWPTAFDLTGGQLQFKSTIRRRPEQPLQVTLQAELTEGKGSYKEILFSGLAIRQDLQLLPDIQSLKDGRITIDTVETGITVKDVSLKTAFSPSPHGRLPKITVRNLSASLFGGTVSDDFLIYDPQQPEVQSTVRLNNIDLARLVTIQQVKGLEVQGKIAGSLPFFFDHKGLQIEGGKLKNTGNGGLIRYTLAGNNGLKESPLTGYALKALEDFHYNLLSATAKYNPDGKLLVGLHLEGKSPRLDTNRPVHLNINTEQNILSLLKSLRYSTSLTDEIDKEVQQHYQEPAP